MNKLIIYIISIIMSSLLLGGFYVLGGYIVFNNLSEFLFNTFQFDYSFVEFGIVNSIIGIFIILILFFIINSFLFKYININNENNAVNKNNKIFLYNILLFGILYGILQSGGEPEFLIWILLIVQIILIVILFLIFIGIIFKIKNEIYNKSIEKINFYILILLIVFSVPVTLIFILANL